MNNQNYAVGTVRAGSHVARRPFFMHHIYLEHQSQIFSEPLLWHWRNEDATEASLSFPTSTSQSIFAIWGREFVHTPCQNTGEHLHRLPCFSLQAVALRLPPSDYNPNWTIKAKPRFGSRKFEQTTTIAKRGGGTPTEERGIRSLDKRSTGTAGRGAQEALGSYQRAETKSQTSRRFFK